MLAVDSVLALKRVAKVEVVIRIGTPIESLGRHEVIERRVRETATDRTRRQISRAYQHHAILVAVLKRSEEPGAILLDWTTDSKSILLAIEGRRLVQAAIERRRQSLQAAVAKVKRTGAVQLVCAGFRQDVDDRRSGATELCRETVGGDLKLLDRFLRDVLNRTADNVVVSVSAVDESRFRRVRVDPRRR